MKTLTLMRHAKSSWANADLSDHERPLNKRGHKAAPDMASRIAERWAIDERPRLLVSSPAVRAATTANYVGQALALSVQTDDRLYPFSVAQVMALIEDLDDDIPHVMLFGHNPGVSMIAQHLGALASANMPTAAVVCMQFDVNSWAELPAQLCSDYWYDFPKNTE